MLHASLIQWIANLALIQDFVRQAPFLGVTWTLAIELIWYGLFAVTLLQFGDKAATRLELLMAVFLILLAVGSLMIGTRLATGRPTMVYAAVIGFQCYRYQAGEISKMRLAQSIGLFAAVALAANYVGFGIFHHPNITLAQALGPWTLATTLFLVIVLVRPIREFRPFNHGLLPFIGATSYSIYLLHPIAFGIVEAQVAASLRVPAALALTTAFALAGYYWVELPGITLGRAVASWWKRSTAEPLLEVAP